MFVAVTTNKHSGFGGVSVVVSCAECFIVEWPRVEPMDLDCSGDTVEGAMQSPEEEMGRDKPSGANAANHNHYSSKLFDIHY